MRRMRALRRRDRIRHRPHPRPDQAGKQRPLDRWRIFLHAPAPGRTRPSRATPWSHAKAPVVRQPRHQVEEGPVRGRFLLSRMPARPPQAR
eukprot:808382-Pyramimonas_sp.AAC.1